MKLTKLLFIPFLALMACSKNSSTPALQNAKVTTTTVTAPSGLTTAAQTNTYASTASSYLTLANTMSNYTANFAVPQGANKTTTTIVASNARVSATATNTVTYTWSDPQYGSVGYQVTDEGTSYKWEYFYKAVGATTWIKYLNAEATKDGSSGSLKVYDFFGSDPTVIDLSFTWTKINNAFTLIMTEFDETIVLNVDLTTKAGTISVFNGLDSSKVLSFKYSWDKDGKGSWSSYDADGITIIDQGTW